jgi:imidazolonepropionase-like amidohydrolase
VWLHGACAVLGLAAGISAYAQDCFDHTDLQVVHGNIHTMDAEFSVVSAARIANGRIVSVGESTPGPCTRVIELDGRTVIPGLIDNHVHLLLTFIRPGHETRTVENAQNVAVVQDAFGRQLFDVWRNDYQDLEKIVLDMHKAA